MVTPEGAMNLTKHHGAGNDFLVLLDGDGRWTVDAAVARALCHRRLGVGADGLIRATPGSSGAHITMELRNADGSEAEMSGNGIRCLVQAAVDAGWAEPGVVVVDTAAGRRPVDYRPGAQAGTGHASVAMGRPELGEKLSPDRVAALSGWSPTALSSAWAVGMGNPHLVLFTDGPVADEVVHDAGSRLAESVEGGANVEFVWPGPGPDQLTLRVWERGVGETLACGTGTCAAVAAAHDAGITGTRVTVHNPGGALEVELGAEGAVLGGPTVRVASVEVEFTR